MITDASEIPAESTLEADVCIVGGGLAGLALARTLRAPRVLLLEGGGEDHEADTQALYRGQAVLADGVGGTQDLGPFLAESRMRCLGGSGNIWGAKCARLDESDFEARAWMPGSGWPFARAELQPFYDRACELLRVPPFDYDPATPFDLERPPLAVGAGDRMTTATRHLSPVRGGPGSALAEYKQAATGAANVEVLLHANVLELVPDAAATRVERVRVGTLGGNRFAVRARLFVLCAGGVENARLLLVSRSGGAPQGLGNAHDLVGRHFSNHATFGPGVALAFTRATESLDLYTTRDPDKIWGVLALSKAAQAREQRPNFTVTMGPSEGPPSAEDKDVVAAACLADGGYGGEECATREPVPAYFMLEQRLNPESRLTLSEERDALGLPRVRLEWRFTPEDADALRGAVRAFACELGAAAQARVRCEWPAASPFQEYSPSRHHIGTTRMHADPAHGVVDADARVHGLANLFVVGSSIFPTPGIANPTLTVIALTLRLAEHLTAELAR
ncbi:MAG: GMC family oxidoreductase [Planctomycetes bacterium]|nr:GMC family oxidoreductase [Planctomycetota bacterium]